MGARLKVTGYVDIDDLDPEHVDLDHPTGLTAEGYDALIVGDEGQQQLTLGSLGDIQTEIEAE